MYCSAEQAPVTLMESQTERLQTEQPKNRKKFRAVSEELRYSLVRG
jgi:hypothetical protein